MHDDCQERALATLREPNRIQYHLDYEVRRAGPMIRQLHRYRNWSNGPGGWQ